MSIKIIPTKLNGSVDIIGSKSYGHRALLAASLAEGKSNIRGLPQSDDIQVTKDALMHFGIHFNNDELIGKPWHYDQKPINCKASGSSLRFFIPLALRFETEVKFSGERRLFERPLDVYEKIFEHLTFIREDSGLTVKGPLSHGHYKIDGHKSSQFLTGLLFALPLVKKDTVIELITPLQSRSYVDMTVEVLKQSGIHIFEKDQFFMIHGNQQYQPIDYDVEGDFSQAAFFFVAGTIGSKITINNLNETSQQGDSKIIEIIKDMGGQIEYINNQFIVYPSSTNGIEIDLSDIPDLGPILMILAALSKGKTIFKSVERLKYKESDRLSVMMYILNQFGVSLEYQNDSLIVHGQETLKGGIELDTYGDHRIAMALAIASIKCEGNITINHPEVVSKSYPNFFEVFKSLGGNYEELSGT